MYTYQEILPPEMLTRLRSYPEINYIGWNILERWAANSPEKLAGLVNARNGMTLLVIKLLKQQEIELDILTSLEGIKLQQNGLTAHEVLEMHEIDTEL